MVQKNSCFLLYEIVPFSGKNVSMPLMLQIRNCKRVKMYVYNHYENFVLNEMYYFNYCTD